MLTTTPTPNAGLPVLDTVRRAWSTVMANRGLAFRLSWPWLAIIVVSLLAAVAGILINSGGGIPSPALISGAGFVPGLVIFLAVILAGPAICVGWHRGIASGEQPSAPIRLDGAVWGYLGYSILIAIMFGLMYVLLVGLVGVIAALSLGIGSGPEVVQQLTALAPFLSLAALPALIVINRFFLVLPATAIGKPIGLGESFKLTRGNTFRLIFGAGLVTLPVLLVQGIGQLVVLATASPITAGLVGLVTVLVALFCGLASLSFSTLALAHLSPVAEPSDEMEGAAA